MKGVLFNMAEEVIVAAHGEDTWDRALDDAELEGAYTAVGTYPFEDLVKLLDAAASILGCSRTDVLHTIGEGAIPVLADRYPAFFVDHTSTRSFVLTLNDVIHSEVRKLYPDAEVPAFEFDFDPADTTRLQVGYSSPRRLCGLAEGFITGAARHFGEEAIIDQPSCMLRGDDVCVLRCTFGPARA